MLYVYYGSDKKTSRAKLQGTMQSLSKRAPHAHVLRVTDEDEETVSVEDILSSQGLFHPKQLVLFDGVMSNKSIREDIFKNIKEIQKSEHVFFIYDVKFLGAHEKKLKTHAAKMEKFDKREDRAEREIKDERQDNFSLANAFGSKNRSSTWLEYRKALYRGVAPEALHGMLFWKVKDTIIKGRCGENESEFKKMVGELAEMTHQTRRDGVELEYALERFILSI
jgi:hypothetical protein